MDLANNTCNYTLAAPSLSSAVSHEKLLNMKEDEHENDNEDDFIYFFGHLISSSFTELSLEDNDRSKEEGTKPSHSDLIATTSTMEDDHDDHDEVELKQLNIVIPGESVVAGEDEKQNDEEEGDWIQFNRFQVENERKKKYYFRSLALDWMGSLLFPSPTTTTGDYYQQLNQSDDNSDKIDNKNRQKKRKLQSMLSMD